ncbi:hypothetical protein [Streptomyces sp. SID13031]|uniref:hypothetical protein n=1 Tax=Streptomyces sp. SID13031 TaxID=2706046 RepID=UPI0013CA8317|nr:hypothetical protein [Streptomyces sp. SID13031]NEA34495.1 hypothetical protein [Streptomyces sp. SID13031]
MTDLPPDEQLPLQLDGLERELGIRQHRWFALAMLLTALAAGITLLLPWTYSRRLGLSVWQLGIETQPTLALTWAAGLIATVLTLILPIGPKSQAAAAITAVIALIYLTGCWQARDLSPLTDTWPGPGPTFALTTALLWLLTTTAHLLATRPHHPPPTPEALTAAQTHLRRFTRRRETTPPSG